MPAEPSWWYAPEPSWQSTLLAPFSALYAMASERRMGRTPGYRSPLPVICVGNFTAGGTGKTPTAIAVARVLRDMGHAPCFLSRGYGGSLAGPVSVDAGRHTAAEVGDEPLLLAQCAPTTVARSKAEGARAIAISAPDNAVIVMDDGFQSPAVAKDLSLVLVDGQRALGNGRVIPSGPLRAPLAAQLARCDAVIVTGSTDTKAVPRTLTDTNRPLLRAMTEPEPAAIALSGIPVLAYAGIANPGRFFATLEGLGARLVAQRVFADHHVFTDENADALLREAADLGATLVTTDKDAVRLTDSERQTHLRRVSRTLSIVMTFSEADRQRLEELLARAIAAHSLSR